MGKTYNVIQPEHRKFIERQPLFFVATAPLSPSGHVNLSPKGYDTLRILSPSEVAYLDLTGSGNETSAHVLENRRITLMFMAIDGDPQILRLYGQGKTIFPSLASWDELRAHFPEIPGVRQIIVVTVSAVKTSCGYGVPLLTIDRERDTLARWATAKGPAGLDSYRREHNCRSIDGLPAASPEQAETTGAS